MTDRRQLEAAIRAQEQLRGVIPDDVVDLAVATLRAQLATADADDRRRVQATVLFADLSGFTAMSEYLDAEVVSDLVNSLWVRLDAIVTGLGGHIDKHIGDALMAVWGVGGAREDDAERAVRAALALQAAVRDLPVPTARKVSMRIGVNSGPVLLGRVGTSGERTVMGDAVNVASRLEHAAPLGSVLVSHETYGLVRGVFDVREHGELTVRGRETPVRAYEVIRAKPRTFRVRTRGVEGLETTMVGRAAELGALQEALHLVQSDERARLVTVIGDPGVGKSRLLYEFDNWLELAPDAAFFFKGRAVPERRNLRLGLLRDVVAARAGVTDGDAPESLSMKLGEATAATLAPDETELLATWLGFEFTGADSLRERAPADIERAARGLLLDFLRGFAATDPLVWLLEDLHWSDDESLDVVEHLVADAGLPLLVVAAGRPQLLARRPDWGGRCESTVLRLAELPADEVRSLVGEILRSVHDVPDALVELIEARAEGNPFFVEELVKMLIDDGVISVGEIDEPWSVDLERLDAGRVPGTLTSVLHARFDALPPVERANLQRASVVGRVFWTAAIAALSPDDEIGDGTGAESETATRAEQLDEAIRRELVIPRRPASFAGTDEYVFKHALLRDVVYDTVLLRERPELHRRAAAWCRRVMGERRSELLPVIADHLERAGDYDDAAIVLVEAAEVALRSGAPAFAGHAIDRAIAAWAAAGAEPSARTLLLLAEACAGRADVAGAESAARSALERSRVEGDCSSQARALFWSARAADSRGNFDDARSKMDEAVGLLDVLDAEDRSLVLLGSAWASYRLARHDDVRRDVAACRAAAMEAADDRAIARSLSMLALVDAADGEYDRARRHSEEALAIAQATGDLIGAANEYGNVGVAYHLRGDATGDAEDHRTARDYYERSLNLARRLGMREHEVMQLVNLAQLNVRLGDPARGAELAAQSLEGALELELPPHVLAAVVYHADALWSLGERDMALAHIGMALQQTQLGRDFGIELPRIFGRFGLSEEELERGLAAGAALTLDEVIATILARGWSGAQEPDVTVPG